MAKSRFGNVRKLPSGRFQARYTGPDGRTYNGHTAEGKPVTFDSAQYADAFLRRVSADIQRDRWQPPHAARPADLPPLTLSTYAAAWLKDRDLADRTRADYQRILDSHILPAFGGVAVAEITPAAVREWHARLKDATGPTMRARAYGLLRTILATAVADEVAAAQPCRVRGAGQVKRARTIRAASLAELETITASVPPRYRLMVLLAAWCALRFGELAELRRSDIDVKNGLVHVRRGVVALAGERKVKAPKSEAGKRDVAIPPHLMPLVHEHLIMHTPRGADALLFPARSGGHMAPSSLLKVYRPARNKAGRPDLRFHDLRHTGAVLAAATGATLAELMARLGHSTVSAALLYQHAAAERDKAIAEALSGLATATVTPISAASGRRKKPAS